MRSNYIILLAFCISTYCWGQQKINWKQLANITFTEKYFAAYDAPFLYPAFSKEMKALEGKKVTMIGYFLNIDPKNKLYILSKGPMSSCFFCGVGGPETVVELQLVKNRNIKTDAVVRVTGILQLNADEVEHFNYILTKCSVALVK
ncbi:MAG: hypothetical protein OIF50_12735 [Flavobacteriaceae bacterium]|nr:hypothetical protein [Flavobacteriaceae bacterium]